MRPHYHNITTDLPYQLIAFKGQAKTQEIETHNPSPSQREKRDTTQKPEDTTRIDSLTQLSYNSQEVISLENYENRPIEERETALLRYQPNYAVIQANELVRSRQDDLSLLEAKLIRLTVAQVLKEDTDLKTYKVSVPQLAEYLSLDRSNTYKAVQDLGLSILKKRIFIKSKVKKKNGKPNYLIFHWVDFWKYEDGIITIALSEQLKPYLIGLNELFTSYRFEEVLTLSSFGSMRLYELLVSYANIQFTDYYSTKYTYGNIEVDKDEVIFTIEELREFFNCNEKDETGRWKKYPNNSDFIRRIIEAGVNEIITNTVLPCSYRLIKERGKIAYVVFKIGDWQSQAGQMVLDSFVGKQEKKKKGRGKNEKTDS